MARLALHQEETMALADPIFFTDDNKTFAELSSIQKDAMSHRGKALRALAEKLREKLKEKKF